MFAYLAFASVMLAQPSATDPDWTTKTKADVEAVYAQYKANHPGWLDPTNPGFRAQLNEARAKALAIAEMDNSRAGHQDALAAFSNTLADGHAKVWSTAPADKASPRGNLVWPQMVMAWRAGRAWVAHSEIAGLAKGSEIIACDDLPIKQWIREKGVPLGMMPEQPGHWYELTPKLLVAYDSIPPVAKACDTIAANGTSGSVTLDWVPAPDAVWGYMNLYSDGTREPIGLSEQAKNLHWIALPTFDPEGDELKAYETLFADMDEKAAALQDARAIVIDLRHNSGGSSSWSRTVADKLWGKESVDRRMHDYFADTTVWYRASDDNFAYIQAAKTEYADRADILKFIEDIEKEMIAVRAKGADFYVERDSEADVKEALAKSPQTDFDQPVYVIVPGGCASACLDAIDVFTRFANTTLIGAPSSADSTYMEVRQYALPSGRARMVIPLKFWHNRPRENGEAYYPAIRMDEIDWTTENFLALVEQQLD